MTQSVALEPREKATGRNRTVPQKEKALERVGRESLIDFFEHLIGETEEAVDGEEMAEEGQRDEAGGGEKERSPCVFLHPFPVRWPSVKSSVSRTCVATVTA